MNFTKLNCQTRCIFQYEYKGIITKTADDIRLINDKNMLNIKTDIDLKIIEKQVKRVLFHSRAYETI